MFRVIIFPLNRKKCLYSMVAYASLTMDEHNYYHNAMNRYEGLQQFDAHTNQRLFDGCTICQRTYTIELPFL